MVAVNQRMPVGFDKILGRAYKWKGSYCAGRLTRASARRTDPRPDRAREVIQINSPITIEGASSVAS